ncbi:hypothetical protein TrVE_jg1650 [Triparma verrucosa]|uniref:Uncharacterized protein n=1 Tax=Triparma verrucosa TaxID=1606542 RepID=A0A9W7FNQ0_9STRA|nr:hypothetical protein TrVE_jg1650 [Triparma verrucosa]
MSKRTSEDLSNVIETLDPNSLDAGDDEEDVFEGSELDSAADDTPAGGGDDFMHTDDFRRLFVYFVTVDTLVAMRWLDKKWHEVVEKKLIELEGDEPFGEIIVHGGNDMSIYICYGSYEEADSAARERMKEVTKVVFLLNITKVGDYACYVASIFVVVDIPEGITIIGECSFKSCYSLSNVKFPKSLTSIGHHSFEECYSLEKVDLLHTNVQKIGQFAFCNCRSLREMKVPDSLQNFGIDVFWCCSKLVPLNIDVEDNNAVVTYLRSKQ